MAVKHFQDHWDIHASDFLNMFMEATKKTDNLLESMYYYPRTVMKELIETEPETARGMFINLYDESKDLAERIEQFESDVEALWLKHGDSGKQHYQNLRTISTYLWLRYPDKYYMYKPKECSTVAEELESDFIPKKRGSIAYLIGAFHLYDEIGTYVKRDEELIQLFKSVLTEDCYPDPAFKILTSDVALYIGRKLFVKTEDEWFPFRQFVSDFCLCEKSGCKEYRKCGRNAFICKNRRGHSDEL